MAVVVVVGVAVVAVAMSLAGSLPFLDADEEADDEAAREHRPSGESATCLRRAWDGRSDEDAMLGVCVRCAGQLWCELR